MTVKKFLNHFAKKQKHLALLLKFEIHFIISLSLVLVLHETQI